MNADDNMERYTLEEREQIAELLRILSAKPQRFQFQFLGVADATGSTVQKETSIWVPDEPTAIRMASDAPLPAEAIGIRVVDHEGCLVFER